MHRGVNTICNIELKAALPEGIAALLGDPRHRTTRPTSPVPQDVPVSTKS